MTPPVFWGLLGMALVVMGLYALIVHAHLLRKVLALNIMSSGVFLVFIGLARRAPGDGMPMAVDPVPQAMVLTGIVVAVASTGLALALIVRLRALTGRTTLGDDASD
jgi:multicomponent Na+:H+ antiporter subunit C